MDQRQKNERINLILKLLMAILFTTGAIIFSYPFLSNAVNSYYDQKMMEKNLAEMAATNTKEQAKRHQEMAEKNKELAESKNMTNIPGMGLVEDPFENEVDDAKDPGKAYYEEHTVGAIYIPKISVSLPLFDETNAALLEKGATILQGTSYPIGGNSTHSVISGHSGLTERKLFTDLEKLVIGDDFYLTIAGEKLAYAVDDIQIVLPSDIDKVVIQPGRDLYTLWHQYPSFISHWTPCTLCGGNGGGSDQYQKSGRTAFSLVFTTDPAFLCHDFLLDVSQVRLLSKRQTQL